MNVVERDALVVDGEESTPQDIGVARRSMSKSVSAPGGASKINRLPSLRDRGVQSRLDFRRLLNDRSRDIQEFVSPLEGKIRQCFKYRARKYRRSAQAQAKVAELVLEVVRQLAYRETGVFNLEAPVPQLLSALFAGSVEVGIVTGLARRAHKALVLRDAQQREFGNSSQALESSGRGLGYDVAREIDELVMLLKWYVRRKMSLCALDYGFGEGAMSSDGYEAPAGDDADALFGLEVMHDHQVFGVKGCLLSCGLRLLGRDGEALWIRVSLLNEGRQVAARDEWSSWTDPGSGGAVEVLPSSAPFCSLVPIRPNSQRLVIDEVRAFVPYAALKLPAGRADVEIQVSVIDGEGREVLRVSRSESICVPHTQLAISPVPSPHSVGMWPHDVVSGDKISELTVSSGFKLVAGWERHCVSVAFDLSLFMHAGESVMLECRFVDAKGDIVELSSLGMPFVASELNVAVEAVSSYRYRRVLHPKGAWALYQGLCVDIPVEFLRLSPGLHEVTCELVAVSADERVLCGDMSRVVVHVPDYSAHDDDLRSRNGSESHPTVRQGLTKGAKLVDLESLEIDSSWRFGGDECIRVSARFSPRSHAQHIAELAAGRVGELFAPYRVEVSLEREDGHVLLQAYSDPLGMSFKPVTRAVCVDPYSSHAEHSVVANFKKDEVLGWSLGTDSGRIGSKWRLFARVTALSLDGEVLLTDVKEFFVKPLSDGGRQVVQVRGSTPVIVDAVVLANVQSERLSTRVLINLPAEEKAEEGIRVQLQLVSANGQRQVIGSGELLVNHREVWTRQVAGLCQYVVELENHTTEVVASGGGLIEISLLSGGGEVLHTVSQGVKVAGVLSEVDDTAADFDSDTVASDAVTEVPFAFGGAEPKAGSPRGLWGRIFKKS